MEYDIDEIHAYLHHNWYDSDQLTDFNMAIDSGCTQYAAYLIKSAGAISPETSKNSFVERAILKLLKGYNPKSDIEECFGNATVYVNVKDNEHAFIKNDYVDYFVDLKDMGSNWNILRSYKYE